MRVLLLLALLAFHLHSYGVLGLSETDPCLALNATCEECVGGAQGVSCYLCGDSCTRLDFSGLISANCPIEDIKVGQCHLSALALIVIISGAAVLLLLGGCILAGMALFCYCKYCRKVARATKPNSKVDTEMREMQERHAQRRAERTAHNDELRRKYGLVDEEDTSKYQRL